MPPSKDILNVALLGTGRIADYAFGPALDQVPGVQLWSVLSRDRSRAESFANKHGAAAPQPAYDQLDALLDDPELDAVIIATPDRLHASQVVAAARAGKHVLVEKPMVTSVEEGHDALAACREAGVTLGVGYHLRWHAGHRALTRRLAEGALGSLRHMRIHWTFEAPDADNWRAGTEVGRWWALAAIGTHAVDLVRWWMVPACGEVSEVTSVVGRPVWQGPHDENAVVALRFDSGATAEIFVSVLIRSRPRVEIYGSTASAVCEMTLGPEGGGNITIGREPLEFEVSNPYHGEIADFASAVREGRSPEVSGDEGLRNVEILLSSA